LLAEGEVFEYQFGTGSEGGAKAGEKVDEEGEHGLAAHDAIGRESSPEIPALIHESGLVIARFHG